MTAVGERRKHLVGGIVLVTLLAAACGSGGETASADGPGPSPSRPRGTTEAGSTEPPPTSAPPTTTVPATTEPPSTPPPPAAVVVIDPGHNGANGAHPEVINSLVDAGGFQKACNTVGASTDAGVTESSINWEVALMLRDALEGSGVEVILTRDSDDGVGPCIDERGQVAADARADLLVSLHADGAPPEVSGFHIIHPGLRPGYTDDTVEPSARLATSLRDALVAGGFGSAGYAGQDGLHQRDDLGTLNRAGVPAVMIEAGNLRNADDAAVLISDRGRARLVDALAGGILAYLG